VVAETAAGVGLEPTIGNVTTGFNTGAPEFPERPYIVPGHTGFTLRWRNVGQGLASITGYLIQVTICFLELYLYINDQKSK
jgi:hypothetical protein